VQAFGDGKIELPKPPERDDGRDRLRYAPSFSVNSGDNSGRPELSYTAVTLCGYTDLVDLIRTERARLAQLEEATQRPAHRPKKQELAVDLIELAVRETSLDKNHVQASYGEAPARCFVLC
jgi:hypothetical protein